MHILRRIVFHRLIEGTLQSPSGWDLVDFLDIPNCELRFEIVHPDSPQRSLLGVSIVAPHVPTRSWRCRILFKSWDEWRWMQFYGDGTWTRGGGLDKIPVNGSKLPWWRVRENEMQAYWWKVTFGTQAWLHDMTKLEDCIMSKASWLMKKYSTWPYLACSISFGQWECFPIIRGTLMP